MTAPHDFPWLQKFTKAEEGWLSEPFSFMMKMPGGRIEQWAAASDGKSMVAVKGVNSLPEAPEKYRDSVISLLNVGPQATKLTERTLSLPLFSAWCGAPDWTPPTICATCTGKKLVNCDKCNGTGKGSAVACKECGENHICKCPHCDRGLYDCDTCGGTGLKDSQMPTTPGRVGQIIVNRQYLARAFQFLSGGTKESRVANIFAGEESLAMLSEIGPSTQPDRILISGPDWRITLMGFRTPDEKDIPVYEYPKVQEEKKD